MNARISSSYRVFDLGPQSRVVGLQNPALRAQRSLMVDVASHGASLGVYSGAVDDFQVGPNNGGALMRPDAGLRPTSRAAIACGPVLEKDAVALFVNGVPYMEHRGLPLNEQVPDELLHSNVYMYFASWTYLGDPAVVWLHWGRIAIND